MMQAIQIEIPQDIILALNAFLTNSPTCLAPPSNRTNLIFLCHDGSPQSLQYLSNHCYSY